MFQDVSDVPGQDRDGYDLSDDLPAGPGASAQSPGNPRRIWIVMHGAMLTYPHRMTELAKTFRNYDMLLLTEIRY